MAYQTYTTEAIVCGSFDRSGADKQFRLYTKAAGMLYATARSVREERSKQRQALQDFSLIGVSLVHGKSGWRIGSVEVMKNLFLSVHTRHSRTLVVAAIRLMNRYLRGEEAHGEVFEECRLYFEFILVEQQEEVAETEKILTLFELRLLYLLGYVRATESLKAILGSGESYRELRKLFSDDIFLEINDALVMGREASHL